MQDMRFIKRITPLLAMAVLVGCGDGADKPVAEAGAASEAAVVVPAEAVHVAAAASGGSAACLDAPAMRTVGNTWTITTDGQRDVNTVAELATYRGQSAYRTHTENSVGTVADAYGNVVDGVVHWYGSVMTQPAINESYNQPSFFRACGFASGPDPFGQLRLDHGAARGGALRHEADQHGDVPRA